MKNKKFVFPLIFLVTGICIISAGLIAADVFHPGGLAEILSVGSFDSLSIKSNTELIDEIISAVTVENNNALPDEINALWVDVAEDFALPEDSDAHKVKTSVYNDLLFYKNFLPDTYFIKPDTTDKYKNLNESDGSRFDILKYLTDVLKQGSANTFLVVDEELIFNNKGDLSFDRISKLLSDYKFNGVLLSLDETSNANVVAISEFLYSAIKKSFPSVHFGVEVHSDIEAQFADADTVGVCEKKIADFLYVDIGSATGDVDYPFYSVAMWWNYFADYYKIPLYCEHRLDKIFGSDELWANSNEINLQLEALFDCHAFDGSCYYNASQLKNKKALARDLSIFLNDVAGTAQDDFFVSSLMLNDNKVTFTAESAVEDVMLFCNDEPLRIDNNIAKKTFTLSNGLNEYRFRGNAAEYDFEIYNNASLIREASPVNNALVNGETLICNAVCPVGAEVYAVFNGSTYKMSPDMDSQLSVPSGYCAYSVSIDLSTKTNVSDLLSFVCIFDSRYEISHINIVFSNVKSYHTEIPSAQNAVASPYTDNGLGKALMCIIKDNFTETISEVEDYDTYHPYNSKLLKGTVDYIRKINVSAEGYIRYELKSGFNVYADDAILVTDGYVMPENKAEFLNYDSLNEKLQIKLDWLSPVNLQLEQMDYKVGYQQFSFNITEFNASYIDINISYCQSIADSELINFAESTLFSSYEIISSENYLTLRLHFRNRGKFFGYDISANSDGIVEVTFTNPFSASDKPVIMLDAGHGGISMVGTALNDNSASEAQITLGIAYKTKAYLEANGFEVLMTRTDDVPLNLSERMALCESYTPDLFISIHCDGSESLSESGTHTFYYTPFSMPLADSIHNSIVSVYTNDIYVPADNNYSRVDRKIKYYPFYVTRVTTCPSVLVETGFLTNYVEGNVLSNPLNQELIAKAISDGICDYFN